MLIGSEMPFWGKLKKSLYRMVFYFVINNTLLGGGLSSIAKITLFALVSKQINKLHQIWDGNRLDYDTELKHS